MMAKGTIFNAWLFFMKGTNSTLITRAQKEGGRTHEMGSDRTDVI